MRIVCAPNFDIREIAIFSFLENVGGAKAKGQSEFRRSGFKSKPTPIIRNFVTTFNWNRGCQIFLGATYQKGGYTKLPQNLPNGQKYIKWT
jgi:hypothetical protein